MNIFKRDKSGKFKKNEQKKSGNEIQEANPEPFENNTADQKTKNEKNDLTKMDRAKIVFSNMFPMVLKGELQRKDVIAKFISDCDLTKNGSATYYGKLRKIYFEESDKPD